MGNRRHVLFVLSLGGVLACSKPRPAPSPSFSPGVGAGGDEASASDGEEQASDEAQPEPSATACEDVATHVYVITDAADLYRFRPHELVFERVGHVHCPSASVPNSMAVDRFGIAWVNYHDGGLYRVSTTDARCAGVTGFTRMQSGYDSFGMAFASNESGETLFVDGNVDGPALGLAWIDTTSLRLARVGKYDGALDGANGELTGTGDGRLYGFFTTKPNAMFARIDPATSKTSEVRVLDGVATGSGFAFSFWGGDFWFYTSQAGESSKVTRLHADDGRLEVVVPDVGGFQIVGAGVSTCAPLSMPR